MLLTRLLSVAFMATSIILILVILVQRGRGGGLAGAFGSGGGSSSAFGTKTGDVFTTFTVILFIVFMLLAVWLNFRFQSHKEEFVGVGRAGPLITTLPAAATIPATLPGNIAPPPATIPSTIPAIQVPPATAPASQPK